MISESRISSCRSDGAPIFSFRQVCRTERASRATDYRRVREEPIRVGTRPDRPRCAPKPWRRSKPRLATRRNPARRWSRPRPQRSLTPPRAGRRHRPHRRDQRRGEDRRGGGRCGIVKCPVEAIHAAAGQPLRSPCLQIPYHLIPPCLQRSGIRSLGNGPGRATPSILPFRNDYPTVSRGSRRTVRPYSLLV